MRNKDGEDEYEGYERDIVWKKLIIEKKKGEERKRKIGKDEERIGKGKIEFRKEIKMWRNRNEEGEKEGEEKGIEKDMENKMDKSVRRKDDGEESYNEIFKNEMRRRIGNKCEEDKRNIFNSF